MDKVQKIREEVERRFEQIKNSEKESDSGAFYQLKELLAYINSLQEKPVSEDLEVASKEWLIPQLDKSYANYGEAKMMELTHFDGYAMLDAIEFGAKWQKAKDESTTEDLGEYINELSKQFPEVSFAKLSRIAVRVAQWQKQQIMKDAVEATVTDIRTYKHENEVDFSVMYEKGIIPYETEQEVKLLILKEE